MDAIVQPPAVIVALFLALVLGTAAAHKLAARDRLAAAVGRLTGLAAPLARVAMFGAAAVEAAAAIALLFTASRPLGAVLAALLWGGYAIALATARRRGEDAFDCGCSFAVQRKPVDGAMLLRPLLLAALALGVAATALLPVAGAPPLPGVEPLFAALALYALYLAAGEIAALPSTRRSLAR